VHVIEPEEERPGVAAPYDTRSSLSTEGAEIDGWIEKEWSEDRNASAELRPRLPTPADIDADDGHARIVVKHLTPTSLNFAIVELSCEMSKRGAEGEDIGVFWARIVPPPVHVNHHHHVATLVERLE
jgi:hypothetical protein